MDGITEAERQSYMTLWAIEAAPLYVGDDLTKLDPYGLSLLTNDEVIAVDQAGIPAKPVSQSSRPAGLVRPTTGRQLHGRAVQPRRRHRHRHREPGPTSASTAPAEVRDLWSHKDLAAANGTVSASLPTHGSQLLKITPNSKDNAPNPPGNLHAVAASGTTAAGNSVTLAWDPSFSGNSAVKSYEVYNGTSRLLTTAGTSVTVSRPRPVEHLTTSPSSR